MSRRNYSWHEPQRQSPAAISILLLKTTLRLLKTFWPVFLLHFIRKQQDETGIGILWILAALGLISVITTIIKYIFYRFYISEGNFIIESGWLKKKTLTLPLKNIMAVHLQQSLWHRFLKVARVQLDSSGSEKIEAKIDALSMEKAEQLKGMLLTGKPLNNEAVEMPVTENTSSYHLSFTDLIKLSLSANHLEAFFILFALGMNIIEDIRKIFNIDGWAVLGDYAVQAEEQKIFAISILIILIALLSVIVSVIRTAIKFYNFNMQETAQGWKISYGLITRLQLIVPYNKIQILSWRANWLRRKLDFWIVHMQSIGHDQVKAKQHIQIPVTRLQQIISLSRKYQQTPVFNPGNGEMSEAAGWKRKVLLLAFPVTVICTLFLYLAIGATGLFALLLFPLLCLYHYNWYRNFRWMANEEGIQIYSGSWGRRYTLLCWEKIQQIELKQGIYQRKHGFASLRLITAGGIVHLNYIKIARAMGLINQVLYLVEKEHKQPGSPLIFD